MNPSLSRALEEAARAACRAVARDYDRCDQCDGKDTAQCDEWKTWTNESKAAVLAFLRHLKTTEEMVAAAIAAGPLQDNKIVRVTLRRAFSAMRDALIREMEKA